jgi:hypothetical protein
VACKAGAGEVTRATAKVGSTTEVSAAAEMPAATEGVAATPEMAAATATVALRESLPAGEHSGQCCHGPESTFAG